MLALQPFLLLLVIIFLRGHIAFDHRVYITLGKFFLEDPQYLCLYLFGSYHFL